MSLITVKKIAPNIIDERGEISNVLDAEIKHVAIITSKAGSIRGNHYHPNQVQYDYLLKGKYKYLVKGIESEDGKTESAIIEAGNLVITPPMVAHAMNFLEDSVFFTFTTGLRDVDKYEHHTAKFKLI